MGFFDDLFGSRRSKHFYNATGAYDSFEVFINDADAAVGDPVIFVVNGHEMPGTIRRVSDSDEGRYVTAACPVRIQVKPA